MIKSLIRGWRFSEYLTVAIEVSGSIAAGVGVAALMLYLLGFDPGRGMALLLGGGLTDPDYLLSRATFIMMTGLAFSIPLLAGLFNIGGEGQMYLGGLVSLLTAIYTGNLLLALLAGGIAGFALGLLIASLRVYRGVNEVITAIMLNWTLYYITIYLITNTFYDPLAPHESIKVPPQARFGIMMLGGFKLHVIFPIALILIGLSYYILYHTRLGFEIRASGLSPKAAKYAGLNPKKAMLYSMGLGGFFAGLGGAFNVLGFTYYIDTLLTTMFGMGFDGIGVALMGRNHPIGIVFSSIFFSMLILGGQSMQMELNAPKEVADALSGIIIIALALPQAYRMVISYIRTKRLIR